MNNIRQQKGISLIEVLISLVILSIGLLGIAAVLIASLRNSQSSMEHSQAVVQAYSVLDAMRSNKPQAIIGRYNMTSWTCTEPSRDSREGNELADWVSSLHNEVSTTACGRVICNSLNCEVAIRWSDERATGGQQKIYSLSTRL